jgi:FixJ family two-component response regulator
LQKTFTSRTWKHGFNVTLFGSGAALLLHADFDDAFCVLLDIDLNKESGIDLRRQLAGRGVELPVIFITGNDSDAKTLSRKSNRDVSRP